MPQITQKHKQCCFHTICSSKFWLEKKMQINHPSPLKLLHNHLLNRLPQKGEDGYRMKVCPASWGSSDGFLRRGWTKTFLRCKGTAFPHWKNSPLLEPIHTTRPGPLSQAKKGRDTSKRIPLISTSPYFDIQSDICKDIFSLEKGHMYFRTLKNYHYF